jgi:hypothetical protein
MKALDGYCNCVWTRNKMAVERENVALRGSWLQQTSTDDHHHDNDDVWKRICYPLPSSFRRIYWQYCSGSRRDPSLPMTKMQTPGGGKKHNDDTSAPQEWHMSLTQTPWVWLSQSHCNSEEVWAQAPAGGHAHRIGNGRGVVVVEDHRRFGAALALQPTISFSSLVEV